MGWSWGSPPRKFDSRYGRRDGRISGRKLHRYRTWAALTTLGREVSPKCAALARAAALNRPGDTDCRGRWDIRRDLRPAIAAGGEEIGDSRVPFLNHQEARRVAGEIEPGQHPVRRLRRPESTGRPPRLCVCPEFATIGAPAPPAIGAAARHFSPAARWVLIASWSLPARPVSDIRPTSARVMVSPL